MLHAKESIVANSFRGNRQVRLERGRNGTQFGTVGEFRRWDTKIRAFGATKTNGVILTGLTAADFSERFFFDQALFGVSRGEYLMIDNLKSFGRIVVVVEFHTRDNCIGTGLIRSRSGALDEEVTVFEWAVENGKRFIELTAIARRAEPGFARFDERMSATDTRSFHHVYLCEVFHLLRCKEVAEMEGIVGRCERRGCKWHRGVATKFTLASVGGFQEIGGEKYPTINRGPPKQRIRL